jgi:hypothetical protein
VGRDKHENESLGALLGDGCHLTVEGFPGAWVYFFRTPSEEDLKIAAGLAVRYSDAKDRHGVVVTVFGVDPPRAIITDPLEDDVLESLRV